MFCIEKLKKEKETYLKIASIFIGIINIYDLGVRARNLLNIS